jgi:hypothetical protein
VFIPCFGYPARSFEFILVFSLVDWGVCSAFYLFRFLCWGLWFFSIFIGVSRIPRLRFFFGFRCWDSFLFRLEFRDFSAGCAVGVALADLLFFVGERCRVTLTEDFPPCLRKPIFLVVFGVFKAFGSLVKRFLIPYLVLLFLFPEFCLVIVQKSSTILITIQLWCANSFGSARKENNKWVTASLFGSPVSRQTCVAQEEFWPISFNDLLTVSTRRVLNLSYWLKRTRKVFGLDVFSGGKKNKDQQLV